MPLPPTRPMRPPARRSRPLSLIGGALLPLALAGCGGETAGPKFPPPCPAIRILPEGGDLRVWNGRGQDITDQVLDGRIQGMDGSCSPGGPAATNVRIAVRFTLDRGPAAPSRVADIPWFIAVAQGNQILDRQAYNLHAVFPPNGDHLALESDPVTLKLPTSAQKSAAAYTVWVSFQLTPAEVNENRTNPRP